MAAVRELSSKHKRELNRVIAKIHSFFNRERYHPRGHVFLDKVVLAHVSKSINVAKSVMALIDAGFPEEAFGLSRTLVEIALNLRYITNRYSERRAKRFVDYVAKWKMEVVRRTLKHYHTAEDKASKTPQYSKTQLRKMMVDYKIFVKLARKFPSNSSWTTTPGHKTKGGAWMMANEPDKHEFLDGKPIKAEFDYDWIYFWTSQYIHATVVSMESHAVLPLEAFRVSIAPHRGAHTAGLAAFNTGAYLKKILIMSFRAIGHPFPNRLASALDNLLISMTKREVRRKPSDSASS
jgi:hypothetical protein